MRTKSAVYIAERLWQDTVADGSLFDTLIKMAPTVEDYKQRGKLGDLGQQIRGVEVEITARWANIIMEASSNEDQR